MSKRLLMPGPVGMALGVALALACFPPGVQGAMVGSMPSGQHDLTPRQAREARVARLLAEPRVAEALVSAGVAPGQVRARLDRLNDAQLDELASNLETVRAGGFLFLLLLIPIMLAIGVLGFLLEQIEEIFP